MVRCQRLAWEKNEFFAFWPLPGQKNKGQRRTHRRCSTLCPGNGACVGARVGLHRRSILRTGTFSLPRSGSHFLSTRWPWQLQANVKESQRTRCVRKSGHIQPRFSGHSFPVLTTTTTGTWSAAALMRFIACARAGKT